MVPLPHRVKWLPWWLASHLVKIRSIMVVQAAKALAVDVLVRIRSYLFARQDTGE